VSHLRDNCLLEDNHDHNHSNVNMSKGIRVFISGSCGNKEIANNQHRITMILKSLSIEFELVDVGAPGTEKDRDFMREQGRKKEGQRHCLPPQIFNGEKYCGDYDAFDIANEDDELEEFLGIPRKHPKADPTKTGATEAEVGKLEPGKLDADGKPIVENGSAPPEGEGEAAPEGAPEAAPEAPAEEAAPAPEE